MKTILIDPTNLNEESKVLMDAFLKCWPDIYIEAGEYKFKRKTVKGLEWVKISLTHTLLRSQSHSNPAEPRLEVIDELLGQGSFGLVYTTRGTIKVNEGMHFQEKKEGGEHLVKIIPLTRSKAKKIRREAEKTAICNPNLHCHAAFFNDTHGFIVMRRAKGMELFNLQKILHSGETEITLLTLLALTLYIMKSLKKLHKNGMVHRDFKSENIIVDTDTMLSTLIDFAFSQHQHVTQGKNLRGSFPFMPPEVYQNHEINQKSDLFCLGYTLAELWGNTSLNSPLDDSLGIDQAMSIYLAIYKKEEFKNLFANMVIPDKVMDTLTEVFTGLICYDQHQRLKLSEAIDRVTELIEWVMDNDINNQFTTGSCIRIHPNKSENNHNTPSNSM